MPWRIDTDLDFDIDLDLDFDLDADADLDGVTAALRDDGVLRREHLRARRVWGGALRQWVLWLTRGVDQRADMRGRWQEVVTDRM